MRHGDKVDGAQGHSSPPGPGNVSVQFVNLRSQPREQPRPVPPVHAGQAGLPNNARRLIGATPSHQCTDAGHWVTCLLAWLCARDNVSQSQLIITSFIAEVVLGMFSPPLDLMKFMAATHASASLALPVSVSFVLLLRCHCATLGGSSHCLDNVDMITVCPLTAYAYDLTALVCYNVVAVSKYEFLFYASRIWAPACH